MVRQSTAVTPEPILGLLVFHQVLQLLVSLVVVSKLVHSYSVLRSVYMRLPIFSILCIIFIQGRGGSDYCIRIDMKLASRSDTIQEG